MELAFILLVVGGLESGLSPPVYIAFIARDYKPIVRGDPVLRKGTFKNGPLYG